MRTGIWLGVLLDRARRARRHDQLSVRGPIKAPGLTEDDLARTVERRLIELKIIVEP